MTLIKDDDRPGQGKAFQEGPDLRRLTACGMTPCVICVIRVICGLFSLIGDWLTPAPRRICPLSRPIDVLFLR